MSHCTNSRRPAHVEKAVQISDLAAAGIGLKLAEVSGHLNTMLGDGTATDTDIAHLSDFQQMMEARLSFMPATDDRDAMAMLMLASADLDCATQEGVPDEVRKPMERRIRRLLMSLIGYLESRGVDRAEFGGEFFAPGWADPHQRLPVATSASAA